MSKFINMREYTYIYLYIIFTFTFIIYFTWRGMALHDFTRINVSIEKRRGSMNTIECEET